MRTVFEAVVGGEFSRSSWRIIRQKPWVTIGSCRACSWKLWRWCRPDSVARGCRSSRTKRRGL